MVHILRKDIYLLARVANLSRGDQIHRVKNIISLYVGYCELFNLYGTAEFEMEALLYERLLRSFLITNDIIKSERLLGCDKW